MKKRAALLALIFDAVTLVGLFLPGVYAMSFCMVNEEYGWGAFTRKWTSAVNFLSVPAEGPGLAVYLALLALAASVVVMAMVMAGKVGKGAKGGPVAALPVLAFVLVLLAAILRMNSRPENGEYGYWTFEFGWLLYLLLALSLAAAVLSWMLAAGKFRETTPAAAAAASANAADQLGKYKELLDAGALTQEEYDAKKKELLNL